MIVYMITAPVFGLLADKGYSRKARLRISFLLTVSKVILVCGVLLWSASTMSTGLCDSFYTIIIPRAFVGIGEGAFALFLFTYFFKLHILQYLLL